jgi:hypothetical protein
MATPSTTWHLNHAKNSRKKVADALESKISYSNLEKAEVVAALENPLVGGKKSKKVDMIVDFYNEEKQDLIKRTFQDYGAGTLYQDFEAVLARTTLQKLKVTNSRTAIKIKEIATMIFDLACLFETFDKTKQSALSSVRQREMGMPDLADIVKEARDKALKEKIGNLKEYIVKPSSHELRRPPLKDGKYLDNPPLRKCICCNHSSMEEPDSNALVLQKNIQKFKEFSV